MCFCWSKLQVSSYSEHGSSIGSVPAATPTVPPTANLDTGIYSRPRFINGTPPTSNHYHHPSSIYKGHSGTQGVEQDIQQQSQQQLNDSSAYSEGSITPTNTDIRSVSPTSHSSYFYGSTATLTGTSFDTFSTSDINNSHHHHHNNTASSININSNSHNNGNSNSSSSHKRESCYSTAPALPARNASSNTTTSPSSPSCVGSPLTRGDSAIYASCGTLARSKRAPPPPLPARRSSTLSDPNAITLATLASTGCSTYEQVQNLRKLSVSDASIYQSLTCDQTIYSNLTYGPGSNYNDSCITGVSGSRTVPPSQVASPIKQQPSNTTTTMSGGSYSPVSSVLPFSQSYMANFSSSQTQQQHRQQTEQTHKETHHQQGQHLQQQQQTHQQQQQQQSIQDSTIESASSVLFGNISALLASSNAVDEQSSKKNDCLDPLPPPPPEAFHNLDSGTSTRKTDSYNRLSNVSDQFLQTLNNKLAVSQQQRMSPRLVKRRSMSAGEHEFTGSDTDSGIFLPGVLTSTGGSPGSTSATSSINSTGSSLQQSFMRLMGAASSALTSSTSTQPSFASSLSARISNRFNSPDVTRRMSIGRTTSSDLASEVAKAAASMAAQKARKFEEDMQNVDQQNQSQCQQQQLCNNSVYSALPAKVAYSPVQSPVKDSPPISSPVIASGLGGGIGSGSGGNITASSTTASPVTSITTTPTGIPATITSAIVNAAAASSYVVVNNGKRGSLPSESSKRELYQSQPRHHSTGSVLSNVSGALGSFENAITSRVNTWFTGRETLMEQIRRGNHQLKKVPDPSDRSQPKLAL